MRKLFGVALFSVLLGMATHFIFYPVVMSWHNERVRLLGRPAIGVLATALPFSLWMHTLAPEKVDKDNTAAIGLAAYLASFLLFGAGTALGYSVDDTKKSPAG